MCFASHRLASFRLDPPHSARTGLAQPSDDKLSRYIYIYIYTHIICMYVCVYIYIERER